MTLFESASFSTTALRLLGLGGELGRLLLRHLEQLRLAAEVAHHLLRELHGLLLVLLHRLLAHGDVELLVLLELQLERADRLLERLAHVARAHRVLVLDHDLLGQVLVLLLQHRDLGQHRLLLAHHRVVLVLELAHLGGEHLLALLLDLLVGGRLGQVLFGVEELAVELVLGRLRLDAVDRLDLELDRQVLVLAHERVALLLELVALLGLHLELVLEHLLLELRLGEAAANRRHVRLVVALELADLGLGLLARVDQRARLVLVVAEPVGEVGRLAQQVRLARHQRHLLALLVGELLGERLLLLGRRLGERQLLELGRELVDLGLVRAARGVALRLELGEARVGVGGGALLGEQLALEVGQILAPAAELLLVGVVALARLLADGVALKVREQVGDKGKVEARVALDDVAGVDELVQLLLGGLGEQQLGALGEVGLLQRRRLERLAVELVQQHGVDLRVGNVAGKVGEPTRRAGLLEVIVDPENQNLLGHKRVDVGRLAEHVAHAVLGARELIEQIETHQLPEHAEHEMEGGATDHILGANIHNLQLESTAAVEGGVDVLIDFKAIQFAFLSDRFGRNLKIFKKK
jgi:hypothetical protein